MCCPGAETGDGPCTTDNKLVGGSAQQAALLHCVSEHRVTSNGKLLMVTVSVLATVVLLWYWVSQGGQLGWHE
jgi:hypothetical protein